jgi:WD40 repeat protein
VGCSHRHTDWVKSVAWSPDGHLLATGSDDRTVRLWDVATGTATRVIEKVAGGEYVMSVAWSPCGELVFAATLDGKVGIYRIREGQ